MKQLDQLLNNSIMFFFSGAIQIAVGGAVGRIGETVEGGCRIATQSAQGSRVWCGQNGPDAGGMEVRPSQSQKALLHERQGERENARPGVYQQTTGPHRQGDGQIGSQV
jgi:hypothetical protein